MTGLNDSAALSIRVKEFVQSKLFKYDKISQQTKQNFIVHIWRDDEMPCSAASKHKWTNHVQMCEWTANIHRLRDTGELARRPSLLSSFDTKSGGDLDRLRYRGLLSLDERPRRSSLSRLRSGLRSLSSRRRSRSLLRLLQYRYNGYLHNNKLKHIIKHQRIHEHSTHTHTHPFNGPLSGTTQVSRYQKGKTNLDFTEARDSEWQYYSISWARLFAICIYRRLAFVQRQSEKDCTSLAVLRRNHGSEQ